MSTRATAPGKIILFGEHAVVYGQPALAVPITEVRATATVEPAKPGRGTIIYALDQGLEFSLKASQESALALAARLVLEILRTPEPDAHITVQSTIPFASGLGSGAAVSAALARSLAEYLNHPISDTELSALVYEVEKVHHGTPSGIDNTVICYNKPVYFIRDKTIEIFDAPIPFHLLIADTGVPSPTRLTVASVRAAWELNKPQYEAYFQKIGCIAKNARAAIEAGDIKSLGPLMNENHSLLSVIGVSSPELDTLVESARMGGAWGAKLSGGGGGGNMIAILEPQNAIDVSNALVKAGAVRVIHTVVG